MKKIVFLVFVFLMNSIFSEEYDFSGTHYVASYIDCNHKALCNFVALEEAMIDGIHQCGATLLSSTKHVFPPDSITMVFLLSESHASIHTYPEYNSCYIDLFTCGNRCDYTKFQEVLKEYLQPQHIQNQIMRR